MGKTGRHDGKILRSILESIETRVIREVDGAAEEALRSRDERPAGGDDALGGVIQPEETG